VLNAATRDAVAGAEGRVRRKAEVNILISVYYVKLDSCDLLDVRGFR